MRFFFVVVVIITITTTINVITANPCALFLYGLSSQIQAVLVGLLLTSHPVYE